MIYVYILSIYVVKLGKPWRKVGKGGKGCKRKALVKEEELEDKNNCDDDGMGEKVESGEPRHNPGRRAQSKLDPDKSWAPKMKSELLKLMWLLGYLSFKLLCNATFKIICIGDHIYCCIMCHVNCSVML